MSLYPVGQYDSESKNFHDRIITFKNENLTLNRSLWTEQKIDAMFEAGDISLWNGYFQQYPYMNKPTFNFNQNRRIKNAILGRQMKYRRTGVCVPVENGDQETADQYTKLLMWDNQVSAIPDCISNAFDLALITGMSMLYLWMDFRDDPISGDLRTTVLPFHAFMMDATFTSPDLSDCNGVWRRSYLLPQELFTLLPQRRTELLKVGNSKGLVNRDSMFNFMMEATYASRNQNKIAYDEFYYREYRDATNIVDTNTAESKEWHGDKEELEEFIRYFPNIKVIHTRKPTVKLAILANGHLQYDGPPLNGLDDYPFVPFFGYFNPAVTDYKWRIQGVIRALRDSTFLFNRLNALLLNMVEAKINTGWIYVDGKVKNPQDTYKTGEGQNIVLKNGAEIGRDIQQITAQEIPTSYFQILDNLGNNPEKISGVNEAMLGTTESANDMSGLLGLIKQEAGVTTLQPLFSYLDRSMKLYDRLRLKAIQANFTPGKVMRILNKKPAPQFYGEAFAKYDIAIQDGLDTPTQKQNNFAMILELSKIMHIPEKYMLENVTIQNKNELLQAIEEEKQAVAQAEQERAQVEMQELQSRAEWAKAKAFADYGQGAERFSRIGENKALAVERTADAIKNEEIATLNMIKAIKELDGMDIQHMQQFLQMQQMIKQQEAMKLQQVEAKTATPKISQSMNPRVGKPNMKPTKTVKTATKIKPKAGE